MSKKWRWFHSLCMRWRVIRYSFSVSRWATQHSLGVCRSFTQHSSSERRRIIQYICALECHTNCSSRALECPTNCFVRWSVPHIVLCVHRRWRVLQIVLCVEVSYKLFIRWSLIQIVLFVGVSYKMFCALECPKFFFSCALRSHLTNSFVLRSVLQILLWDGV